MCLKNNWCTNWYPSNTW